MLIPLLLALQADLTLSTTRFLEAPDLDARQRAAEAILAVGAPFDEVYAALSKGRVHSADVPRGRILRSRVGVDGLDHKYMLLIPEDYTPDRAWPVRWDLHGGMGAPEWTELDGSWSPNWRTAHGEIVVVPAGWWDSMWWEWSQAESFEAVLEELKRTWNVDENRVVLHGSSDGCIATYFYAMRQPDRWAGYAGHVGSPDRLVRADLRPDGQMHLANLSGQRFHLGFGERDPKTPLRHLERYMALFEESGAVLDWFVVPKQGHSLVLPIEKERELGKFLRGTLRDPLPDRVSWSTERTDPYARRSWVVIDELTAAPSTPTAAPARAGHEILPRWGSSIQLRGATTPRQPFGRVIAERHGQRVLVTTTGVGRFRLLISPAEFDLAAPIQVELNGTEVFHDWIEPSVETLLRWAALDQDRSLLFAAELPF